MNHCDKHIIREKTIPTYRPEALGLDGVYLHDAVVEARCEKCGVVKSITIPNLQSLIAAAAVARVLMPLKLRGKEIRYLREALEQTAQELAGTVEVLPTQISRWENDAEPISPRSEKLLRMYVVDQLAKLTAMKVNRNRIYEMRIRAWRSLKENVRIDLRLADASRKELPRKKREPKWRGELKPAA